MIKRTPKRFAVLATGPSLNQQDVDKLRGKVSVVAVSDAYKLAPWCDALASTDINWWRCHEEEILKLKCAKYHAGQPDAPMDYDLREVADCSTNLNSGALGIMVAHSMGATDIILLGFDMTGTRGAHFFGSHEPRMKDSPEHRFDVFRNQFRIISGKMDYWGVRVVNCTPQSHLLTFPFSNLEDEI